MNDFTAMIERILNCAGVARLAIRRIRTLLNNLERIRSRPRATSNYWFSDRLVSEPLEDRLLLATVEFGDFVAEVASLKSVAFSKNSDRYVAPTSQQRNDFRLLAENVFAGNLEFAESQASGLGYEVIEFTESISGDVYHGLREVYVNGRPTKGWGTYFVNLSFQSDALVEIPHPVFDTRSWEIGAKTFRESHARGFLMAGAHRNANGLGTADVAHLDTSIFHEVHQAWVGSAAQTDTWQVHGFSHTKHSFPNGTDSVLTTGDGNVSSEVLALDAEFESSAFESYAYNTLDISDSLNQEVNGHFDGAMFWTLGGTKNQQGQQSRSLGGSFISIELERSIRFDANNRNLAAADLARAMLTESAFAVADADLPFVAFGEEMTVVVNFDAAVDVESIDSSDLLIGDQTSNSFSLFDSDTIVFTFSGLEAGRHEAHIAAGTLASDDGTSIGNWTQPFFVAPVPESLNSMDPTISLERSGVSALLEAALANQAENTGNRVHARSAATFVGDTVGDLTATMHSDDEYQVLTERIDVEQSAGLNHQWQFRLAGAKHPTFVVEAFHTSTTDMFDFEYSTNGVDWFRMLAVTNLEGAQTYSLPAGDWGAILVRAIDTDRSASDVALDSLFVDELFFLSGS